MSLFKIIRLDTVETLYGIQKRAHYFFFKSCNQQSWCKTSSKHLTLDFPGNKIFRSTIFFSVTDAERILWTKRATFSIL